MSDKVPPGLDGGSTDPRVVAGTHFLYGLGKGFMSDITNTGHLIGVNIDDQGVRLHTAEEWGKNYSGLGRGLVYGAQHPGEILRAVGEDNLHLTTWQTDPWLAAGETLGGMTYTVGTAVIGGELGEAAKIAEEGNAAVTAAEKVAPAWERAAELAARAGKSESLKELSGIPTNLPGLASKLYGTGDALKELSENAHPGDDSESQTGFAPGTTQVVETSTYPFALQLEVNVYRPGTGRDDGDEGSRMLQGHVDQTELRTGVEQDQPTESPQSAEGWSSRVTEADVHAALYHGPDSHRGPGGSDPPAETPALAGQQPGPQIPAGQTPDPQTPGSQTTDGASGSSSGPPAQSTPPLQGHVDQTELRTGVEQDQPSETLPSAQGSDSRSTEADVHAELAPGQGTPMVQESVQGVVRQYPNATQPPESSIETLGSDLPVALQAQQGVLTPEMVQQALAAQPAPSAQTTDDQTPTAQTPAAQTPAAQTPDSPPGYTQPPTPQSADSPPGDSQSPDTQNSGSQTPLTRASEAAPGSVSAGATDGAPALQDHVAQTELQTGVQQDQAVDPPQPAQGSDSVHTETDVHAELVPEESSPAAQESVQGVVRQYPNATQPPESSIETLGSDLPVALQAQQGVLTPEMVQQALAAQPAPSAQTTDDQTPTAQTPAAQTPAAQTSAAQTSETQAPPTETPAPASPESSPGTTDWLTPGGENSPLFGDRTAADEAPPGDSGGDKLYVDGQGTYFTLDPDGLPQVVVPDQVGDRQAVDINATDTDLVNDAYKNGATGAVVAAEPVDEDPGSGSLLTSALAAIQSTQIETETFDQAAAGQQNETFIASENPATSGGTVEAEGAGVVTSSESGSSTETSGNSAEGGGVSGDAGANQASNDGSSSDAESSHGGSPQTGDGSGVSGDGSASAGDGSGVSGDGSASAGDGSGVSGDGSASAGDGSAMTGDGSAPTVDESAPAASDPAPEVSAPPPEAEPPPPSD